MYRKLHYVYICTNILKTVLYIGVTNDLARRLYEHEQQSGVNKTFAGRYNAHHLIYYEEYPDINSAIAREKEIKAWRREKKMALINQQNPEWKFIDL